MKQMQHFVLLPRVAGVGCQLFFKLFKKTDGNIAKGDVSIISKKVIHIESVCVVIGSFSDQAGHFGSSWPGGGERPPIRYEDSWGGLRGPSDTQLLIYSYIKR